jgi:DNA-binding NarL/FixJ family response regulator
MTPARACTPVVSRGPEDEDLGRFAGRAAHRLGEAVALLDASAALLRDAAAHRPAPEFAEALQALRSGTERTRRMMADLHDMARPVAHRFADAGLPPAERAHPPPAVPQEDPPASRPRVVLGVAHPARLAALTDALEGCGVPVVAVTTDGPATVEACADLDPEVAIVDVALDGTPVSATVRGIRERASATAVLLSRGPGDIAAGIEALSHGAIGEVAPGLHAEAILHAVQRAARGEPVLEPELARELLHWLRLRRDGGRSLRPVLSPLSDREWQVLDMLCSGLTRREIAERLVLAPETVRTHVKRILRKLGVDSQREAVAAAARLRAGLDARPPAAGARENG